MLLPLEHEVDAKRSIRQAPCLPDRCASLFEVEPGELQDAQTTRVDTAATRAGTVETGACTIGTSIPKRSQSGVRRPTTPTLLGAEPWAPRRDHAARRETLAVRCSDRSTLGRPRPPRRVARACMPTRSGLEVRAKPPWLP